jgi:hypothetical protein
MRIVSLLGVMSGLAALVAVDAIAPIKVDSLWKSGLAAWGTVRSVADFGAMERGVPCRWPNRIRLPLACAVRARGTPSTVIFWQH